MGYALAILQADVEAVQQNMERSTQERGIAMAALQADMARVAGCLNQARSALSDHAQQLGRLSQLPIELSGVAEDVICVQRDVAEMKGRLEVVAVLPAQLESVAQQVTALGSKQEDTMAAVQERMISTGQQIEGMQAQLAALQAQTSTLGQQCEKHEDMASRLAATEVQLDGIEQVSRAAFSSVVLCRGISINSTTYKPAICKNVLLDLQVQRPVSAIEGRIRAVECTVAGTRPVLNSVKMFKKGYLAPETCMHG